MFAMRNSKFFCLYTKEHDPLIKSIKISFRQYLYNIIPLSKVSYYSQYTISVKRDRDSKSCTSPSNWCHRTYIWFVSLHAGYMLRTREVKGSLWFSRHTIIVRHFHITSYIPHKGNTSKVSTLNRKVSKTVQGETATFRTQCDALHSITKSNKTQSRTTKHKNLELDNTHDIIPIRIREEFIQTEKCIITHIQTSIRSIKKLFKHSDNGTASEITKNPIYRWWYPIGQKGY